MNLLSVSLRNVHVRKLSSGLTTLSVALGAALIAAIWLMIAQTEDRYKQSYQGYRAIVGPNEGAPLTLVLSTVMNLGYAPGVVPLSVYRELHDGRLADRVGINYAIPQARGDYYRGFPIVGTTDEWFTEFARGEDEQGRPRHLEFAAGSGFEFGHEALLRFADDKAAELEAQLLAEVDDDHDHDDHDHGDHDHAHGDDDRLPAAWRQAVLGADVARQLDLGVGDEIVPVHGVEHADAHVHEEASSAVVGVLASTGTPIDRSIYVPLSLFLSMDKHEAIRPDAAEIDADEVQLSAIIVDAKNPVFEQTLRYEFQARRDAQVAWTWIELAQLFQLVDNAADLLRAVSWLVIVVAAIGVCVSLYNTMNERRREIAIMRSLGARRGQVVQVILLEAVAVSFVGATLGVALAHLLAWGASGIVVERTGVALDWAAFSLAELWLILGVTAAGALAGIAPAVKGSTTEVAAHLGPVS